jgi:hypothetical protein
MKATRNQTNRTNEGREGKNQRIEVLGNRRIKEGDESARRKRAVRIRNLGTD